ncbi:hypothetical protein ACHAXT_004955 [Thalassiosira profunda]
MASSPPQRAAAAALLLVAATAWAAVCYSCGTSSSVKHDKLERRWRTTAAANATFGDPGHRHLRSSIQLERTAFKLPGHLGHNLLEWTDPPAEGGRDLPVFWHILKSGGTTVKLLYAQCYGLVEACETGALVDAEGAQLQQQQALPEEQSQRPALSSEAAQQNEYPSPWEWMQQQISPGEEDNQRQRRLEQNALRVVTAEDGRKYVNVDVTTPEGIARASQLGFASSQLADVMFTPLLIESADALLGQHRKGRLFALFRHPINRVVSIFYYLQNAMWEPTYSPAYADMTIEEYATSPYCESNWMVRSLTGKMTGPLSPEDILVAQEVLKRKCLVGLMDRMEESLVRYHNYFRFGNDAALQCAREHFAKKGSGQNTHRHPKLDPGSEAWKTLQVKNELDIRLYDFARELFVEQGNWMKKENLL